MLQILLPFFVTFRVSPFPFSSSICNNKNDLFLPITLYTGFEYAEDSLFAGLLLSPSQ